jgi:micrococcal nuclease
MRRFAIASLLMAACLLTACGKDEGRPLAPRADSPQPYALPDAANLAARSTLAAQLLKELASYNSEEEVQAALDKICSEVPADAEEARLQTVIDGDTIILADGRHVRYIGMDAPERDYAAGTVAPYTREAADYNAQLLQGKRLVLIYDAERLDVHKRTLAYVFARPEAPGGKTIFVNAEIVRAGFARAYPYPPNIKYSALMFGLQEYAALRKRGLWRDTQYGFVGSARSHIFHRLNCEYGVKIARDNRVEFKTRREALEAGYVPCKTCAP